MVDDDTAGYARDRILEGHRGLLVEVGDAADVVAERWDGAHTTDRDRIVNPLARELDRRDLLDRFPGVLSDGVEAAGHELQAPPVPAPPYIVVTSTGPVLRATVPAGRLVLAVRVFEVARDPVRYRRRPGTPADALVVSFVDG